MSDERKNLSKRGPWIALLAAPSGPELDRLVSQVALAPAAGSEMATRCRELREGDGQDTERLAIVADDSSELTKALAKAAAGKTGRDILRGSALRAPRVGFMFTGQGSQYSGMGRELYERFEVFRQTIDRCAAVAADALALPLKEVLFDEAQLGAIDQTGYTQPCLYALECALADLLGSWGVLPKVVLGHSVGEYAAARSAGVFSLETGMRLIAERGRLMQALPAGGKMAALALGATQAEALLVGHEHEVALAADNGPESVVISGSGEAVAVLIASFKAEGGRAKELVVSHAFHSPLMEPMLDAFESFVANHSLEAASRCALISNVTASPCTGQEREAGYWRRHVRAPVRFRSQIAAALDVGVDLMIEIGPDPILTGMAMGAASEDCPVHWIPLLRRGRDPLRGLVRGVAAAVCGGLELDWERFEGC